MTVVPSRRPLGRPSWTVTAAQFFWILLLSFVVLWLFFVVIGSISPAASLAATAIAAARAVLYGVHAWRRGRITRLDRRWQSDRERRGF